MMSSSDRGTIGKLWADAEANPGTPVPVNRTVVCDVCSVDYTDRPDSGGFIFLSKAYCPACAAEGEPAIRAYREEAYIRARCPEGQSFADFVRAYRGPDAVIKFETFPRKP